MRHWTQIPKVRAAAAAYRAADARLTRIDLAKVYERMKERAPWWRRVLDYAKRVTRRA